MPHNTTPHPTESDETMMAVAITEKPERGVLIAAKKAMGSQLEGASDDEGEDSAGDELAACATMHPAADFP